MISVSKLTMAAGLAGLVAAAAVLPAEAACKRMGFLVNDYGKDGPTKDAQALLDKHIAQWAAEQGIEKYTVGKKEVSCELFLNLIVVDEHTCTASANVCWGGDKQPKEGAQEAKSSKGAASKSEKKEAKTEGAAGAATKAALTADVGMQQPDTTSDAAAQDTAQVSQPDEAQAAKPAEKSDTAKTGEAKSTDGKAADRKTAGAPGGAVETGALPLTNKANHDNAARSQTSDGAGKVAERQPADDDKKAEEAAASAAASAERAAAAAERAAAAAEKAAALLAEHKSTQSSTGASDTSPPATPALAPSTPLVAPVQPTGTKQ